MKLYLDLETGGFDVLKCAILQMGLYEPKSSTKVQMYISPGDLQVTEGASRISNYPKSHENHSIITIEEALEKMIGVIKGFGVTHLVCHNATFDGAFLKAALSRCGIEFILPKFLCTYNFCYMLRESGGLPIKSLTLEACVRELEPTYPTAVYHQALEDAMATYIVERGIINRMTKLSELANKAALQQLQSHGVNKPTRSTWGRR